MRPKIRESVRATRTWLPGNGRRAVGGLRGHDEVGEDASSFFADLR